MPRPLRTALVLASALALGLVVTAAGRAPRAAADALRDSAQPAGAAAQPPHDPKRKKAGEPCKSSDECQRHHSCEKVGDSSVCKAPPPPRLPPGAVT